MLTYQPFAALQTKIHAILVRAASATAPPSPPSPPSIGAPIVVAQPRPARRRIIQQAAASAPGANFVTFQRVIPGVTQGCSYGSAFGRRTVSVTISGAEYLQCADAAKKFAITKRARKSKSRLTQGCINTFNDRSKTVRWNLLAQAGISKLSGAPVDLNIYPKGGKLYSFKVKHPHGAVTTHSVKATGQLSGAVLKAARNLKAKQAGNLFPLGADDYIIVSVTENRKNRLATITVMGHIAKVQILATPIVKSKGSHYNWAVPFRSPHLFDASPLIMTAWTQTGVTFLP